MDRIPILFFYSVEHDAAISAQRQAVVLLRVLHGAIHCRSTDSAVERARHALPAHFGSFLSAPLRASDIMHRAAGLGEDKPVIVDATLGTYSSSQ